MRGRGRVAMVAGAAADQPPCVTGAVAKIRRRTPPSTRAPDGASVVLISINARPPPLASGDTTTACWHACRQTAHCRRPRHRRPVAHRYRIAPAHRARSADRWYASTIYEPDDEPSTEIAPRDCRSSFMRFRQGQRGSSRQPPDEPTHPLLAMSLTQGARVS